MSPDQRPTTPIEALDIVPTRLTNIKTLLTLFCTLPVTTCTAERSFSAMRILKNHMRTSMTDERLTGLALMYVHPEIDIDIDNVIDQFAMTPVTPSTETCESQETVQETDSTDNEDNINFRNLDDGDANSDSGADSRQPTAVKRRRLNLV